jgi:sarcosine oxidase subunit alpha
LRKSCRINAILGMGNSECRFGQDQLVSVTATGQRQTDSQRENTMTVQVDGRPVAALVGDTVAAVLLAQGIRQFRRTPKRGEPRGVFCGMGVCYECLVTVDGVPNVRACMTAVAPGMNIETGQARSADASR